MSLIDQIKKELENASPEDKELIKKLLLKEDEPPKKRRTRAEKKNIKQSSYEQRPSSQQRVRPLNQNQQQPQPKKVKQERQSRTEPLNMNRPNLFVDQGFANQCKSDVKTDQKLSGSNATTPRGNLRMENAVCRKCQQTFQVAPQIISNDPEFGPSIICNDCGGR